MKPVLIDENLPSTLVSFLGPRALHATQLGDRLSDEQLWNYAREHHYILLTKDSDFFDRLSLQGPPPKVVWVRTGNLRRLALEEHIQKQWPSILSLLTQADLVQIHPNELEALRFD